jgi:hypothetical protein
MDDDEVLVWTTMLRFEAQAAEHYALHVPELAAHKPAVAMRLAAAVDGRPLDGTALGPPTRDLVAAAAGARDATAVLVVQGLVLERIRRIVYATLARVDNLSDASRMLARELEPASAAVVEDAEARFGHAAGAEAFAQFAALSDDVLAHLDALGEAVDTMFGARFNLRFADIVGELVADLVPACVALGMDRRKVMSHLAGALMGI